MAQSAQSIARLVDTPLYRGLKIDARPSKILYSPGIVGILAVILVDFRTIPNSWADWKETAPYRIETELIIPPGATVSLRNISARVYAPALPGMKPSQLTTPSWGVEYDESPVERTILVNGQESIELETLVNDPSAIEILDGRVVGETKGEMTPVVEIPGSVRFPERGYGWLRIRHARRLAKAWVSLPLFTDYWGFPHNGAPALGKNPIEINGRKIYPRRIPYPNPFVGDKRLLALTARGLQKAKRPSWTIDGVQITAALNLKTSEDIQALLGADWQTKPLIAPVEFSLSVSTPGRAAQTIQSVVMLPEPEVDWGEIWMITANSMGTGKGFGVGMPEKLTEDSRETEEVEIPLINPVGRVMPFKLKVNRVKTLRMKYPVEEGSQEWEKLDMEFKNE